MTACSTSNFLPTWPASCSGWGHRGPVTMRGGTADVEGPRRTTRALRADRPRASPVRAYRSCLTSLGGVTVCAERCTMTELTGDMVRQLPCLRRYACAILGDRER